MSRHASLRRKESLGPGDFKLLKLPEEYWDASLDKVTASVRKPLKNYIAKLPEAIRNGMGLYLFGPQFVGKTAAAAVVLKETRLWGVSGLFVTTWALREALLGSTRFDSSDDMTSRARSVEALVLDNLRPDDFVSKEESGGNFFRRHVEGLLSERRSAKKTTIVTSRYAPNSDTSIRAVLESVYGAVLPIYFDGTDAEDKRLVNFSIASGKYLND